MSNIPKLKNVIRLDSMKINKASFTDEGYMEDCPILTSTGIFEYTNPDGSIRRELRLSEEVFDEDSLKSYKGKPIIITHNAGLIDKKNVQDNQIGTILSDGIRDGENVKAEIIIHDTDEMKKRGLKELSLGYNLDLDETPGVWNGEKYDAIQRNIRVNHLALVREARAGEQARLNIDSRDDKNFLKGGKVMKVTKKKVTRKDSILSPEELQKAIDEYKAKRAAVANAAKGDADDPATGIPTTQGKEDYPMATSQGATKTDEDTVQKPEDETPENMVDYVKARRDVRDENGDPANTEEAMGVIAHQDEDIETLINIIDTLLAERDFGKDGEGECGAEGNPSDDKSKIDGEEGEVDPNLDPENTDAEGEDDPEDPENTDGEGECDPEDPECRGNSDADEEYCEKKMNADSIDAIVRERVKVGLVGRKLNLDGLENLSLKVAKKKIIRALRPSLNLDGKSNVYINALFDSAVDTVNRMSKKTIADQKKKMFNRAGRLSRNDGQDNGGSISARQRMIERQSKADKK